MILVSLLHKISANKKAELLYPYLKKSESLLDFGCGDLEFSSALKQKNPLLSIVGIDVLDFGKRHKGIKFVKYGGGKLPFKKNSFDTVICFYVLHHCTNLQLTISECVKVAKKRVIVIEAVPRFPFETHLMKMADFIFNIWKEQKISPPVHLLSEKQWKDTFQKNKLKIRKVEKIKNLLSISPVGKELIFELYKNG